MLNYASIFLALIIALLFLVGRSPKKRLGYADMLPIAVVAVTTILFLGPNTREETELALLLVACFLVLWTLVLALIAMVVLALGLTINRWCLLGTAVAAAMLSLPLIVVVGVMRSCSKGLCV